MGTKTWVRERKKESLGFLELATDTARTNALINLSGDFLAIKTDIPLSITFQPGGETFEVNGFSKFYHRYDCLYLTHNAQPGGKILIGAGIGSVDMSLNDYDTKIYYTTGISTMPTTIKLYYPSWMKKLCLWITNYPATVFSISITDYVISPVAAVDCYYTLQSSINVFNAQLTYNLIEGDYMNVVVTASIGTPDFYMWARFRRL